MDYVYIIKAGEFEVSARLDLDEAPDQSASLARLRDSIEKSPKKHGRNRSDLSSMQRQSTLIKNNQASKRRQMQISIAIIGPG